MRMILLAATAAAGMLVSGPASAQAYFGVGPAGAGVEVGPFAFGVGPRYGYYDGWRDYRWYGRGADERAFAYVPRYRRHYGWRSGPNVYQRPFMRWDPYGRRWDGAD